MILRSSDSSQRSVLIVDQSDESREVFRLTLERKGMKIFETDNARQGLELAQRHHPDVIVLDMEAESANDTEIRNQYDTQSADHDSALVVLGAVRRDRTESDSSTQFVSKPYHYAPLIRTIEQLLNGSQVTEPSGSFPG